MKSLNRQGEKETSTFVLIFTLGRQSFLAHHLYNFNYNFVLNPKRKDYISVSQTPQSYW